MGNTKKWTMKTGEKIRIKDMTDSHLLNTLKMLKKNGQAKLKYMIDAVSSFPGFNGEQAQIAFEQMEDTLFESEWDDYVPEIFSDLVEEAGKRNLDVHDFLWGDRI